MHKKGTKLVRLAVVSLVAMSFTAGCAHMEKSPPERHTGWLYIHKPLPEASRKVDEARAAGKSQECPAEFNAAKSTVDKAYDTYIACHTDEAIAMAQDGINKLNALCPRVVVVPNISISSDPTAVKKGRCANLNWTTTGASSVSIDQGIGTVPTSGAKEVCPSSTTRYTVTATGEGGTQTGSTVVTIIPLAPKIMTFEEAALFDFDKAELKPAGKEQIKAYRDEAQAELSHADKVIITGHTDNKGTAEYNQKLSVRRAEAVRDYLLTLGVPASKMEVAGAGESKPIADNGTPEGRAKNRRVEIEIIGLEK